ncbi:THAP domain-containing protein 9 [Plakobranchus ocellatus]|uniref:THAP domain-containing protein 9 n=1 Tax=Plakobranchus ocellatus TaxID=259542 RepID=A0AAV4D6J5_9GAST|nr:THAP domain-containing protein 9 [Plakobranchus ocellatus]
MSNLNLRPGFCFTILDALKIKVSSRTKLDKECTLIFDKMPIKEAIVYNVRDDEIMGIEDYRKRGRTRFVANHALVFTARGLTSNWKQPFGFFFSSGTVKDTLLKDLLLFAILELEKVVLTLRQSYVTRVLISHP